ncbi:hypothetical protein ACFLSQ_06980 [Bacteroidota bacterium]
MNNEIKTIDKNPWEQLKGEKSRQFLAFCQYLELGDRRSLTKIAAHANLTPRCIYNWAKKWNWEERASAFDRHNIEEIKMKNRKRCEKAEKIHSKGLVKSSLLLNKLIALINKKTKAEPLIWNLLIY